METNLLNYLLLLQVQMIQLMQVYMETEEIEVWDMLRANHLIFHKIAETSFPYHEYFWQIQHNHDGQHAQIYQSDNWMWLWTHSSASISVMQLFCRHGWGRIISLNIISIYSWSHEYQSYICRLSFFSYSTFTPATSACVSPSFSAIFPSQWSI